MKPYELLALLAIALQILQIAAYYLWRDQMVLIGALAILSLWCSWLLK